MRSEVNKVREGKQEHESAINISSWSKAGASSAVMVQSRRSDARGAGSVKIHVLMLAKLHSL